MNTVTAPTACGNLYHLLPLSPLALPFLPDGSPSCILRSTLIPSII